jgi:hypothetical protein
MQVDTVGPDIDAGQSARECGALVGSRAPAQTSTGLDASFDQSLRLGRTESDRLERGMQVGAIARKAQIRSTTSVSMSPAGMRRLSGASDRAPAIEHRETQ